MDSEEYRYRGFLIFIVDEAEAVGFRYYFDGGVGQSPLYETSEDAKSAARFEADRMLD